jgi:cyanophycinase-like exopeptidase
MNPGPIILFGSGETSPSGRKVFEQIVRHLPARPKLALLDTPAGFELNAEQVIGRVGAFLEQGLQNYQPQVSMVRARKRGTPFSPDSPAVVQQILEADLLFMGPGSPTYAVRQLCDSPAWHALRARQRLGAPLVLASAAVVAISAFALPVYEIYKVGEDLHWKDGLDLFGDFGLPLVFIPHWNNNDGGAELDTSRCFMGESRFSDLIDLLPGEGDILGIDEKTALILDLPTGEGRVEGLGGVTVIHAGPQHRNPPQATSSLKDLAERRSSHIHVYASGERFPLSELGPWQPAAPARDLPSDIWQAALEAQARRQAPAAEDVAPEAVLALAEARWAAKLAKQWAEADQLRGEIDALGWVMEDGKDGWRVRKK